RSRHAARQLTCSSIRLAKAQWLDNLNALGAEGWEVVSDTIIYGKGSNGMQWPVLLLKRRKQATTE
ncbi:DUF4177 domain-containing protein, partial [Pseudonocardia tropica]